VDLITLSGIADNQIKACPDTPVRPKTFCIAGLLVAVPGMNENIFHVIHYTGLNFFVKLKWPSVADFRVY